LAFNKQQGRTGTLFETPFKRAHVQSQQYLVQLVYYIHANPQAHGLTEDFRDWRWSSFRAIASDGDTQLERMAVISWFGDRENFLAAHSAYRELGLDASVLLE